MEWAVALLDATGLVGGYGGMDILNGVDLSVDASEQRSRDAAHAPVGVRERRAQHWYRRRVDLLVANPRHDVAGRGVAGPAGPEAGVQTRPPAGPAVDGGGRQLAHGRVCAARRLQALYEEMMAA